MPSGIFFWDEQQGFLLEMSRVMDHIISYNVRLCFCTSTFLPSRVFIPLKSIKIETIKCIKEWQTAPDGRREGGNGSGGLGEDREGGGVDSLQRPPHPHPLVYYSSRSQRCAEINECCRPQRRQGFCKYLPSNNAPKT